MKACYLTGRPGTRVDLDGPALKVRSLERASVLLPLQRLSRVVASGPVEWSTAALLACAERGITVTFLHSDGRVRAYLFGEASERESLFQRLRDFLDRADWRERYQDWQRAMTSRARRVVLRQLGEEVSVPVTAAELEAWLRLLKRAWVTATVCDYSERRLRGLCQALAAEELAAAGLNAERARALGQRLDVVGDLARLLEWGLQIPLLELLQQGIHGERLDDALLVRLFEEHALPLRRVAQAILNRMHGWLVEM